MHKKSCVYWIHTSEQTDIFTQGYVGVSVNGKDKRYREHRCAVNKGSNLPVHNAIRKYKNILCEIVVEASLEYCYEIEFKLRPEPCIGYNVSVGGICTNLGNLHSEETRSKISKAVRKHLETHEITDELRTKRSENGKKLKHTEDTKKRIAESQKKLNRDLSPVWAKAAKVNSELKSWQNPFADKHTWINAAQIFKCMQDNSTFGSRRIAKATNTTIGKIAVIYKKIKSGWIPLEDEDWLIFSSKLTPDTSGDKSLETGESQYIN